MTESSINSKYLSAKKKSVSREQIDAIFPALRVKEAHFESLVCICRCEYESRRKLGVWKGTRLRRKGGRGIERNGLVPDSYQREGTKKQKEKKE